MSASRPFLVLQPSVSTTKLVSFIFLLAKATHLLTLQGNNDNDHNDHIRADSTTISAAPIFAKRPQELPTSPCKFA